MEHTKRAARRRHSSELKARVLATCAEPRASVANIALAHGLNANLVHKWRRRAERADILAAPLRPAGAFIPLTLTPSAAQVTGDIRIELRRGATAVKLSWPVAASAECACWLREIMR